MSRIPAAWLGRFVALSVRFTWKVVQFATRFSQDTRGARGSGANASGRIALAEGARTLVRVPGSSRPVRATGHSNDESPAHGRAG